MNKYVIAAVVALVSGGASSQEEGSLTGLAQMVEAPLAVQGASRLNKTSRLVVAYRGLEGQQRAMAASNMPARLQSATVVRASAQNSVIYDLGSEMSLDEASDAARTLKENPDIISAEPDIRVRINAAPSDPYYAQQWGLHEPKGSANYAGINVHPIWNRTKGSGVTVAVLDTGIVAHPQLAPNLVQGFDFVTDLQAAGDGNGRDGDPTDPGDYCSEDNSNSSWHGTKVASIIAAVEDGAEIIGVAPSAKILNVRVAGRCGGWLSDIADGIRWTGGAAVQGAPAHNRGPIVMNISLGTDPGLACPAFLQSAVDAANKNGSIVVVAAGNESANDLGALAACRGVVVVGSHTATGDLADYSNYSPKVTISGPGGGVCKKATAGCQSMGSATVGINGKREYVRPATPEYSRGTSFAAPFVAASLGLMKSLVPGASREALVSALTNSARPFPAGSFCYQNAQCAFGMLEVSAAMGLLESSSQFGALASAQPANAAKGQTVTLTATASSPFQGASFNYAWNQVSGPSVALSNATTANATFKAPAANGDVVFNVRVTDASNRSVDATVSVSLSNNTAPELAHDGDSWATAGTPWSYKLYATDADNNFKRLAIVSGPAGMTSSGATLTWNAPVAGVHEITVIAVDADNLESRPVNFRLTVKSPDGGPTPSGSGDSDDGGSGGGAMGALGGLLMAMAGGLKLLARRRV